MSDIHAVGRTAANAVVERSSSKLSIRLSLLHAL